MLNRISDKFRIFWWNFGFFPPQSWKISKLFTSKQRLYIFTYLTYLIHFVFGSELVCGWKFECNGWPRFEPRHGHISFVFFFIKFSSVVDMSSSVQNFKLVKLFFFKFQISGNITTIFNDFLYCSNKFSLLSFMFLFSLRLINVLKNTVNVSHMKILHIYKYFLNFPT